MYHLVFVYGTLLRGQVNHHLMAGASYLGPHRTVPGFGLYNLGTYPGLTRGGRTAVIGEVYRVDGQVFRRIDRLEEHPRLYRRCLLATPYGRAWVYLLRKSAPRQGPGAVARRRPIPSGDWLDLTRDPTRVQARAIRSIRNPKNQARRGERSPPRPCRGGHPKFIQPPRSPHV
jgi:gamma-glutamylaminecyclotransferase